MNFLRGFSFNATTTGLIFFLGFFNQALLAEHLGQANFGHLKLWFTTVLLASLFLGEWLSKGNTYVMGKGEGKGAVICNTLIYGLSLGLLLLLIAGFCMHFTGSFFLEINQFQWPLLAGLIVLTLMQKSGQSIVLGEDRIKVYSLIPVVFIVVYLGGNVLLLGVWDLVLEKVLLVWFSAVALTVLLAFIPLVKGVERFSMNMAVFKRVLYVGGRGSVSVILIFLLFRSNVYLIDYFLGKKFVGVYAVATIFADMMQRLPNIAGVVLLPKVIRGQGEVLTLRVAQGTLLFSLVAAASLALSGKFFLMLFFPAYADAYGVLLWMLPGLVFAGFGSVFNVALAGQAYPALTLWAPALALALNLTVNWALIPVLGLRGAALSTSIAYGAWALLVTGYYLRRANLSWWGFLDVSQLRQTFAK